ncbi:Hypothetical protein ABZS17D1_03091 [Kosakonia cowanii]
MILICRWTRYFKLPSSVKKVTVLPQKKITVTKRLLQSDV